VYDERNGKRIKNCYPKGGRELRRGGARKKKNIGKKGGAHGKSELGGRPVLRGEEVGSEAKWNREC